jgi:hypothetical protein
MAPEQGLGEAGDERSDLYSLGVIVYQLLTGELPYEAEAPLATILKHLNSPIPYVSNLNPDVPEPVDRLIRKLMAKAPADRYQNASDLIEDLERIEQGDHVEFEALLEPDYADSITSAIVATPPVRPSVIVRDNLPPDSPRRGSPLLLGGITGGIIVIVAAYFIGLNNGTFPPLIAALASVTPSYTPSDTPTLTDTPTATDTAIPTETNTPTRTPTATATSTPSDTPTATATATNSPSPTRTNTPSRTPTPTRTNTPSRTPTITLTPTITDTPLPPTPDITQTLLWATQVLEQQTATVAACDFDYAVVEQDPADGDFFQANTSYHREIRLLNTGTCAWERNTSLVFIEGEDFNAERTFIRERVNPSEEVLLNFEGVTPTTGGLRTGLWELRTPGQILIGQPLEISIRVFEQGN